MGWDALPRSWVEHSQDRRGIAALAFGALKAPAASLEGGRRRRAASSNGPSVDWAGHTGALPRTRGSLRIETPSRDPAAELTSRSSLARVRRVSDQ